MANIAFRLLLTFNATSLLLIIFLVKESRGLSYYFSDSTWATAVPNFTSYFVYFLIPVALTGISIRLSAYLGSDEFKKGSIESIEHANNSFLPSYLGYFFVALSVPNDETLLFVYAVLFVFTFLSQALYFNPLFLIYGYEFYNIKTNNGTAIFLITRQRYKKPDDIDINKANRINDYTFLEGE